MTKRWRCLMVGAGGMAGGWIRQFYPKFPDRVEITGLVDVNAGVLAQAGDYLGLPASHRFTTMAEAFDKVDADFCTVVIPPAFHKEAVLHAVRRKLPILSEKPIADTWESCTEIYRAVTRTNLKMQVMQNYRYDAPMLTFRRALREGTLGRTNYLVGRFTADYREWGAWGAIFRHTIPHALLVEGAVHHMDMLRNLSGSDCETLAGWEWNPAWSTSKGAFNNLYVMTMANGVHASYEGSGTAAGEQHSWHEEYYRAECEHGSVTIGRDRIVRTHRHARGTGLTTQEVPPERPAFEGHTWVIQEFLDWLDGGPTPPTVLADNIKSVAMIFAAMACSATNQTVNVQAMVDALQ